MKFVLLVLFAFFTYIDYNYIILRECHYTSLDKKVESRQAIDIYPNIW